ncbi:MAG: hypothetical protein B7X11_03380 [Acidobacteria bacterium 37-65-4]|nr:MAG: hypothetical protein B7X11_03380 [Acidobacteria bacterium 37-65-4]
MVAMNTPPLQRAIEILGGQSALARACNVKQAHVWNWLHRAKKVPAEQVITIETATKGLVTRSDLRPDIYPPENRRTTERCHA